MITFSEFLQEARTHKHLSFRDIEDHIHIRSEYIQALEEADFKNLPADIYVRGMLKKYACFLDIDYDNIIRLYRTEKHLYENIQNQKQEFLNVAKKSRIWLLSKIAFSGVFGIFFIGIFGYLISRYYISSTPPEVVITSPPEGYSFFVTPLMIVEGSTKSENEVFLNNQKILTDDTGHFSLEYYLQEGENILYFTVISSKKNKTTEVIRKVEKR